MTDKIYYEIEIPNVIFELESNCKSRIEVEAIFREYNIYDYQTKINYIKYIMKIPRGHESISEREFPLDLKYENILADFIDWLS